MEWLGRDEAGGDWRWRWLRPPTKLALGLPLGETQGSATVLGWVWVHRPCTWDGGARRNSADATCWKFTLEWGWREEGLQEEPQISASEKKQEEANFM